MRSMVPVLPSALSILALAAVAGLATPAAALPPGFIDEPVSTLFNQATGLTFGPDGRMYVWEKAGVVWIVENGVRLAQPLIDISQEVNAWRDFGLLGFALDPDFQNNGRFYLLYDVDHHHLQFFGTPQYNPNTDDWFVNTIARLTRYTARAEDGRSTADPASRTILIGETAQTGIPVCHQSHSIGTLAFGSDGTLIISSGDAASYETMDNGGPISGSSNTALAEGIITPAENVGAFRAQLVNSHNGKILRVNPENGDGIPSNPFYNPGAPRSPQSRVWALGLRNPFRMSVKPGGSTNPADGCPGEVWIGDVGWNQHEETNVARTGGENFGWPIFEGLNNQFDYSNAGALNRTAPNPLAGQPGCSRAFFDFRDLLVQETLNNPSWPNPCSPAQQIPASLFRFEHTRPLLDWFHASGGPARTGTFTNNLASESELGTPGCPIAGQTFGGNSSTGGVWYTGTTFPPEYQNTYFFADFGQGWMRALHADAAGNPQSVELFSDAVGAIVCLAVNPIDGGLYYVNYDEQGQAIVRRMRFTNDRPPVVVASATPGFGPLPLSVAFSAVGTTDPEGLPLTYRWDFGDGSPPSDQIEVTHIYNGQQDVTNLGTIVARVYSLTPPGPQGGGNQNPEVIRDGDVPPVGNNDSSRQFDTFHGGDQQRDDWIGYTFTQPLVFSSMLFQEGIHFGDGGWFNTLRVEYLQNGTWRTASGFSSTPPYPGNNGINFESFRLGFTPTPAATGLRIRGVPGGSAHFISVGELHAIGRPAVTPTTPMRYDATLTVTDPLGNVVTRTFLISPNNTPPQVTITSPVDGSLYSIVGGDFDVPLTANIVDAEHPADQLTCSWQTILHHNDHTHPEQPDPACATQSRITRIGCDGNTYFYEFKLTVTDAQGLATTTSSFIYPNCCRADFNNDGIVNSDDLSDYITAYFNTPADPTTDFDGSGTINADDLGDFITGFFNGC